MHTRTFALFLSCVLFAPLARAQTDGGVSDGSAPPPAAPEAPRPRPPAPEDNYRSVVRAPRPLDHVPGATSVITARHIAETASRSVGEALRATAGVNIVGENDGMGLRLNVGFRGLEPDRGRKVLVLEDGVPVSLNPYGTPEMYYTPPVERMERIEVMKGSGSILFGPQTIGGVINFVTRDPPRQLGILAEARYGNFGYVLGQVGVGNTHGAVGYRVDVFHRRYGGPRNLDLGLTDVTAKVRAQFGPDSTLVLKANVYDESSRATYLGLTGPQFAANPQGSYAVNDRMEVRRYSLTGIHEQRLFEDLVLQTSVYAYETTRTWRRQDYDRRDLGAPYERTIPGEAGAPPDDGGGTIFFRQTNGIRHRVFRNAGVESRLSYSWSRGPVRGDLLAGARLHYEDARVQYIVGSFPAASSGAIRDDEFRTGWALAVHAQHRFTLFRRLQIVPGLRLETLWAGRRVLRYRPPPYDATVQPRDVDAYSQKFFYAIIPGLGLSYEVGPRLSFFAGVHRGFAPPRTQDAITPEGRDQGLDAEWSWNYELGLRVRHQQTIQVELTGFFLDFQNQIIPPSEAAGAVVTGNPDLVALALTNSGETRHAGLESSLTIDPLAPLRGRSSLPLTLTYTYLPVARFVAGVFDGKRLPYAPEHILWAQLRFAHRSGASAQVGATYVSSQFADKENTRTPTLDGLRGVIPGYFLLDARVAYRWERPGVTVYLAGKNLTNSIYVASRAPGGIQPAGFLEIMGGLQYER